MPLFSIIIPSYNRAGLLQETLASVFAQQTSDYEVIVVDDGSTDETLQQLALQQDRVQVLQQEHRGPGAARNLGMRHAKGEYLAFLDSDDLWFPWTLTTYVSVIRDTNRHAFIAGKPHLFREAATLKHAKEEPIVFEEFADYLASGDEWRWWGVSSFVMQREAVQACGGFAEANINGEDADLALKLGTAPGFVQIMSPVTFGYREHAASLTADLQKNLAGLWHKVNSEQSGCYPGGESRAQERWRILTRHVRPMALACLRAGRASEGWRLYRATFSWHMALGRWKFLLGFPWRAITRIKQPATAEPGPV